MKTNQSKENFLLSGWRGCLLYTYLLQKKRQAKVNICKSKVGFFFFLTIYSTFVHVNIKNVAQILYFYLFPCPLI